MFGDREKCCNCSSSESTTMLHIQYMQKINKLEVDLYEANRVIKDLVETNKHLARTK